MSEYQRIGKPYTIFGTAWKILHALAGGPLKKAEIVAATGLNGGTVDREILRLEGHEYIDKLTTGRYRLDKEKGRPVAEGPCPEKRVAKERKRAPKKAPPPPVAAAPVGDFPLSMGERAALEYLAAHPGQSIGVAAEGLGRTPDSMRDICKRLSLRGMLALDDTGGHARVPVVTAEGKARTLRTEGGRVAFMSVPAVSTPLTLPEAGMAILRALLVAASSMTYSELAAATGLTPRVVAEHVEPLAAAGCAVRTGGARRTLVALTEKGQRMANGDLVTIAARRIVAPCPVPVACPVEAVVEPPPPLVPPAFMSRRGVQHPTLESFGFTGSRLATSSLAEWS